MSDERVGTGEDGVHAPPFRVAMERRADGTWVGAPLPRDGRFVAHVNRWPLTAWGYDPIWRARSTGLLTGGAYGTRQERRALTEWLLGRPARRVLDVGCGSGFYLRALRAADAQVEVHGVESSAAFLRVAARRLSRDGVDATLVQADAHDLPYADGVFDGVAWGGVPNEFRDPERALAEGARVLAPGGRAFFLAVAEAENPVARALQAPARLGGLTVPTADAWIDMLEGAGLRAVRVEHRSPLLVVTLTKGGA